MSVGSKSCPQPSSLRASCACTSTILIRDHAVVCATCGSPILAEALLAEVSSFALPPDAKSREAFNRACRSGRVAGARRVGRCWIAPRAAWDTRRRAPRPFDSEASAALALDDEVLAELGAQRSTD